jgi:hypothetical protein
VSGSWFVIPLDGRLLGIAMHLLPCPCFLEGDNRLGTICRGKLGQLSITSRSDSISQPISDQRHEWFP